MHICSEEVLAFLSLLPIAGFFFRKHREKILVWYRAAKGLIK